MKLYSRAALVLSAALMMCVSTLSWVGSASAETTVGLGIDVVGNDIYDLSSDNAGREEYRVTNDEKEIKVTAFGMGKIKAGKGCVDIAPGEVTCSLAVAEGLSSWANYMAIYGSRFDDNIELNTKLSDLLRTFKVYGNPGNDLIDASQANVDGNSGNHGWQIRLEGNDGNDRLIAPNKPHPNPGQKIFTSLVGGYDDDTLVGGPGKDDFIAESTADGDDTITNADEKDSAEYYYRTDPVVVRADGSRTSGDPKAGEKDLIPSSISFIGGGKGDDTLAFSSGLLPPNEYRGILGREGNDTIYGSNGDDVELLGAEGDDTVYGLGGKDTLYGDEGNNTLIGGDEDDIVYGGEGNDDLQGGDGNDVLFPSYLFLPKKKINGDDRFSGGKGVDTLSLLYSVGSWDRSIYQPSDSVLMTLNDVADDDVGGGVDNVQSDIENIVAGDEKDTIVGSVFGNEIDAGAGDDIVDGAGGDDRLVGGDGVDELKGDAGIDVLSGNEGDDTLDGGVGVDDLKGGDGIDTLRGGVDNDVLSGDEGVDVLDGQVGDDTLDGGVGDDRLVGGMGNDVLSGGVGSDTVDYAGSRGKVRVTVDGVGDDGVLGEQDNVQGDNEVVVGSAFDDVLIGSNADDGLFGGKGDDQLDGGMGSDRIDGGDDNDSVVARDGVIDVVLCGSGSDIATVDAVDDVGNGDCETIDVLKPKVDPPASVPPSPTVPPSSTGSSGDKGSAGQQELVQPTVPVEGKASTLRLAFVKPVWKVVPTKRRKTADIRFTASQTAKVRVGILKFVKVKRKKNSLKAKTRLVGVKTLTLNAKVGVNIAKFKLNRLKPGMTYVLQVTELGAQKPASATAKLKLGRSKQRSR